MFHSINWVGAAIFLAKVLGGVAMVVSPFLMLYLYFMGVI